MRGRVGAALARSADLVRNHISCSSARLEGGERRCAAGSAVGRSEVSILIRVADGDVRAPRLECFDDGSSATGNTDIDARARGVRHHCRALREVSRGGSGAASNCRDALECCGLDRYGEEARNGGCGGSRRRSAGESGELNSRGSSRHV